MNYYQHHIGDFNNATRHLTRVERALYRDLIELYYDKEQPLISDKNRLARLVLAVSDEEKEAVNTVLGEFFTIEDGEYHNSRCDKELIKYRSNSSAKARAGKASAEARRARKSVENKHNSTGVEQVLNETSTEPQHNSTNQEPRTKNQEPRTKENNSRFKRPSESEIQDYELEKGLSLIGFHDYYESNGWKVGRNHMKDWKASARGWSKRQVTNRKSNEANNGSRKNATAHFYENLQAIHDRSLDI